jgi:hypothetical protein
MKDKLDVLRHCQSLRASQGAKPDAWWTQLTHPWSLRAGKSPESEKKESSSKGNLKVVVQGAAMESAEKAEAVVEKCSEGRSERVAEVGRRSEGNLGNVAATANVLARATSQSTLKR